MRYACLLRGINVSGHRKLTMPDLLAMCGEIGLSDASSLLQSGNLIVGSKLGTRQVGALLEKEIHSRFGYADIDVIALDAAALNRVVDGLPSAWKAYDTSKCHFTFLKEATKQPDAGGDAYLPDEYVIGDRVVYVHCPDGYGRTKLNNAFFERLLRARATTRNWNTTIKLRDLVSA